MAWITNADFKTSFPAAIDASDGQVNLAKNAAEDELVELVGQTVVDDAKDATPTDAERSAKIIRGHSFLSLSIFLLNTSNLKKTTDAGSPGIGGVPSIVNEYESISDSLKKSEFWREKAIAAIKEYLTDESESEELGEQDLVSTLAWF